MIVARIGHHQLRDLRRCRRRHQRRHRRGRIGRDRPPAPAAARPTPESSASPTRASRCRSGRLTAPGRRHPPTHSVRRSKGPPRRVGLPSAVPAVPDVQVARTATARRSPTREKQCLADQGVTLPGRPADGTRLTPPSDAQRVVFKAAAERVTPPAARPTISAAGLRVAHVEPPARHAFQLVDRHA